MAQSNQHVQPLIDAVRATAQAHELVSEREQQQAIIQQLQQQMLQLTQQLTNDSQNSNDDRPSRYIYRKSDLPNLDLNVVKGEMIDIWIRRWRDYTSLSRLDQEPQERQVEVLRQCLSMESLRILHNLNVSHANNVEVVLAAINQHAKGIVNPIVERRKLFVRTQRQDESINEYIIALRALARTGDFCDHNCRDRAVATSLVIGLRNPKIVEALLTLKSPTLDKMSQHALAMEAASIGRRKMNANPDQDVNRLSTNKKHFDTRRGKSENCGWCGGQRHQRSSCPAQKSECHKCGKVGHYGRVCKSSKKINKHPRTNQMTQEEDNVEDDGDDDDYEELDVATIRIHNEDEGDFRDGAPAMFRTESHNTHRAPKIKIHCDTKPNGSAKRIEAIFDTGADITVAGISFLKMMGVKDEAIEKCDVTARTANGTQVKSKGKIPVTWTFEGITSRDQVIIMPGVCKPLISWYQCKQLGLLSDRFPVRHVLGLRSTSKVNHTLIKYDAQLHGKEKSRLKLIQMFPQVFGDNIGIMKGEDFVIHLENDAIPFCVRSPRAVPLALREDLKKELDLLQYRDIIEPVTKPTEWCSPIVVDRKKNGNGVRLCVDFTKVNVYVKRERYVSDPPHVVVATIDPEAEYFSTIDAVKGYHQCPLAEESRDITTFITPFGRYRYKRAPFGISSISEHYNRRMDEALNTSIPHKRTTDDVLIPALTIQQQFDLMVKILSRCDEEGITLSKEKFRFAEKEVIFGGFKISKGKYEIDPAIIKAVKEFPQPTNLSQVRSFFGLANQLTFANTEMIKALTPLRPLLSPKNEFIWDDNSQQAFEMARRLLAKTFKVAFYQPDRPMRLMTDASRSGLGFVLQQQHRASSEWVNIQVGSRMLTPAESRYAIVELELLAICFAVRRCHLFVCGSKLPITVLTDHRPLISMIMNKRLDEFQNPRLLRMRQFLMPYNIRAEFRPGKDNHAADALSRAPVDAPVETSIAAIHIRPQQLPLPQSDLMREVERDSEYQELKQLLLGPGFPTHRNELQPQLRQFWPTRMDMSIHDDLIFVGQRVLIPRTLYKQTLRNLHKAHQGAARTKERARHAVYWPHIDKQIDDMTANCEPCQRTLPANPQMPLQQHVRPSMPGQHQAADLFEVEKQQYLVITDVYSTWPEVWPMTRIEAEDVSEILEEVWSRNGIPEILYSDGGPQFTATVTREMCKNLGVKQIFSAPRYPQSNSHAESAVKSIKKLVMKSMKEGRLQLSEFRAAIRGYRNTPQTRDGLAPSQKWLGRRIRDELTVHPSYTAPISQDQVDKSMKKAKEYDHKVMTKSQNRQILRPMLTNQRVIVWDNNSKSFCQKGTIVKADDRRYSIKMDSGSTITRDRHHIRPVPNEKKSAECDQRPSVEEKQKEDAQIMPPPPTTRSGRRVIKPKRFQ